MSQLKEKELAAFLDRDRVYFMSAGPGTQGGTVFVAWPEDLPDCRGEGDTEEEALQSAKMILPAYARRLNELGVLPVESVSGGPKKTAVFITGQFYGMKPRSPSKTVTATTIPELKVACG